jgi:hypothetical protein
VKGGKVPEDGGGGRDRPVLLFSPPSLRFALLPSGKSLQFDVTEYPAKPLIGFEDAKVVHTITSGKVEEDWDLGL